jgi:hypothetical protein
MTSLFFFSLSSFDQINLRCLDRKREHPSMMNLFQIGLFLFNSYRTSITREKENRYSKIIDDNLDIKCLAGDLSCMFISAIFNPMEVVKVVLQTQSQLIRLTYSSSSLNFIGDLFVH